MVGCDEMEGFGVRKDIRLLELLPFLTWIVDLDTGKKKEWY